MLRIAIAAALAFCLTQANAQAAPSNATQSGGSASGPAHAAVLDAEHRPITAGGFVKTGPIVFQDGAAAAGLTSWHHTMGTPQKTYILEAIASYVLPFTK